MVPEVIIQVQKGTEEFENYQIYIHKSKKTSARVSGMPIGSA
jgi:hypothetical protein